MSSSHSPSRRRLLQGAVAIGLASTLGLGALATPASATTAPATADWQKQESAIARDIVSRRPSNMDSDSVLALYARQEAKLWADHPSWVPKVEQARIDKMGHGGTRTRANITIVSTSSTPNQTHLAKTNAAGTWRTNVYDAASTRFGVGAWPYPGGRWIVVELFSNGSPTASNRKTGSFRTADGYLTFLLQNLYGGQNGDFARTKAIPGAWTTLNGRDWGNVVGTVDGGTGRGTGDSMEFVLWSDFVTDGASAGKLGTGAVLRYGIPIQRLYLGAGGKAGAPANANAHFNALRSGTTIAAKQEEFAKAFDLAGTTNADFVNKVLTRSYGRTPTAAETSLWVGRLNAGSYTRGAMLGSVVNDATGAKNLNAKAFTAYLVANLLGRTPTATDLANPAAASFQSYNVSTGGKPFVAAGFGAAKPLLTNLLGSADLRTRAQASGYGW